ncbi:hypothetical protein QQ045_015837 [Rhodiola kirilowii]
MDQWKPFMSMVSIGFAFAVVNILLKEVLNQGLNHLVFITYRLAIAAIFLAPIGYYLERNSSSKLTFRVLCYLFFSAIVGTTMTMYFFLIGIQYTSATFACAFVNMVPVMTFILALPFRLETINLNINTGRVKALGTIVCIIGAIMLTSYKGMPLFNHVHSHTAIPAAHHQAFSLSSSDSDKAERWTFGLVALVAVCSSMFNPGQKSFHMGSQRKNRDSVCSLLWGSGVRLMLCWDGMVCQEKRPRLYSSIQPARPNYLGLV